MNKTRTAVLRSLADAGPGFIAELAARVKFTTSSVGNELDRMEKLGLVWFEKRPNARGKGRPRHYYGLTEAGKLAAELAKPAPQPPAEPAPPKLTLVPCPAVGTTIRAGFRHYLDGRSEAFREPTPHYPQSERQRNFRERRSALGLSLHQAADRLGISVVELSGLELGRSNFSDWDLAEHVLETHPEARKPDAEERRRTTW